MWQPIDQSAEPSSSPSPLPNPVSNEGQSNVLSDSGRSSVATTALITSDVETRLSSDAAGEQTTPDRPESVWSGGQQGSLNCALSPISVRSLSTDVNAVSSLQPIIKPVSTASEPVMDAAPSVGHADMQTPKTRGMIFAATETPQTVMRGKVSHVVLDSPSNRGRQHPIGSALSLHQMLSRSPKLLPGGMKNQSSQQETAVTLPADAASEQSSIHSVNSTGRSSIKDTLAELNKFYKENDEAMASQQAATPLHSIAASHDTFEIKPQTSTASVPADLDRGTDMASQNMPSSDEHVDSAKDQQQQVAEEANDEDMMKYLKESEIASPTELEEAKVAENDVLTQPSVPPVISETADKSDNEETVSLKQTDYHEEALDGGVKMAPTSEPPQPLAEVTQTVDTRNRSYTMAPALRWDASPLQYTSPDVARVRAMTFPTDQSSGVGSLVSGTPNAEHKPGNVLWHGSSDDVHGPPLTGRGKTLAAFMLPGMSADSSAPNHRGPFEEASNRTGQSPIHKLTSTRNGIDEQPKSLLERFSLPSERALTETNPGSPGEVRHDATDTHGYHDSDDDEEVEEDIGGEAGMEGQQTMASQENPGLDHVQQSDKSIAEMLDEALLRDETQQQMDIQAATTSPSPPNTNSSKAPSITSASHPPESQQVNNSLPAEASKVSPGPDPIVQSEAPLQTQQPIDETKQRLDAVVAALSELPLTQPLHKHRQITRAYSLPTQHDMNRAGLNAYDGDRQQADSGTAAFDTKQRQLKLNGHTSLPARSKTLLERTPTESQGYTFGQNPARHILRPHALSRKNTFGSLQQPSTSTAHDSSAPPVQHDVARTDRTPPPHTNPAPPQSPGGQSCVSQAASTHFPTEQPPKLSDPATQSHTVSHQQEESVKPSLPYSSLAAKQPTTPPGSPRSSHAERHSSPLRFAANSLGPSLLYSNHQLLALLTTKAPRNEWATLTTLDISGTNHLGALRGLDVLCPALQELRARRCHLNTIADMPKNLKHLDIAGNELGDALFASLQHLSSLEYLDISDTGVSKLEVGNGFRHLKELRADKNAIETLSNLEGTTLVHLSLRSNRLTELDCNQLPCAYIEELILSKNVISHVRDLGQLQHLQLLNLEHNELTELHSDTPIPTLRTLRVSYNQLHVLNCKWFPEAHILYADCNLLQRIDGFNKLKRLDSLSLREQQRNWEMPFDTLPPARNLYLSGNPFPDLNHCARVRPELEFLELSGCSIVALPHVSLWPNLRVLNLNYNHLRDLSQLHWAPELRRLLLVANRIDSVDVAARVARRLPKLQVLDLRRNPISSLYHAPLISTTAMVLCLTLTPYQPDPAWREADQKYRANLSDLLMCQRAAYRAAIIRRAPPTLCELDGQPVLNEERSEAEEILRWIRDQATLPDVSNSVLSVPESIIPGSIAHGAPRLSQPPLQRPIPQPAHPQADAPGDAPHEPPAPSAPTVPPVARAAAKPHHRALGLADFALPVAHPDWSPNLTPMIEETSADMSRRAPATVQPRVSQTYEPQQSNVPTAPSTDIITSTPLRKQSWATQFTNICGKTIVKPHGDRAR